MRRWTRALCLAGLALSLAACAASDELRSVSVQKQEPSRQTYVPGEYIVTTRANVDAETISRLYAAFGVENVKTLSGGRILLRLARDPGIDRIRSLAVESGQIEAVQRNFIYRTQ